MTRSSRHKSHKQSKHHYRDYSDSEEDVKMERNYRDENPLRRSDRDSASGEKRKILPHVRESKDSKDLTDHGNGQVVEEYGSSKRRKEKSDTLLGGDRWNGGGEERRDGDRNVAKEASGRGSMRIDPKSRESSNEGESLKIELKNKSKRHETGSVGERKEDSLVSAVLDKEENKGKGESKRKPEKDSSTRKEKESKDKECKLEKEKIVQESKHGGDEVKLVEVDVGKKQVSQPGDTREDRHAKCSRSNTERATGDDLRNPELEKESEKILRRRREGSTERNKYHNDSKEADEKRLSSRGDRAKETKYKDDKQKDVSYADKHQEDGHKDARQRDEKNREEPGRDNKYWDDKYREGGDKEAKHKDDKHEDSHRYNRRKAEKHREDGDLGDSRRKDDKYREGTEREHRDDKYHDDGDTDSRRKDDRYCEVGDKDNRKDERYYEDGDRDDRPGYDTLREDGDRDSRLKDGKHQEDIERDIRHKDRVAGDDFDREKRQRSTKYRDEYNSRDRSGDKSDPKGSRDDGYGADHYSRKSSAYDDSPTHNARTSRYRDDQARRKVSEKEDYDVRSRSTKDRRSNAEKKSANSARMDPVPERGRSTSRNADIELTSSQSRRRNSPGLSSHDARDHFRVPKQDGSKYRDVNYEDRVRHSTTSTREYIGTGGSENSPWSDKLGQKGDSHLGELSGERRLKSDIRPSSLHLVDKSPSSSADKRQFSRPDFMRSIDVGESTHRSAGFRDVNEYPGNGGRGSRELPMDVLPGNEALQADADTLSVSSPLMRNSHFSNSSKSFQPPPPFRTGMDSPLPIGSAEDDSRGKSNNRHRRIADSNMGRIQGNTWSGIPSWPSPLPNGFLPFPHTPPPIGFMHPFPTPQIFGVRPSMELNHPLSSPYHMPDADRFPGQVHPRAWRQVDDSFNAWDASNSGFGDESHNYGRPNWDPSRNLPSVRGWETSGDLWKGNNTQSLEIPSFERETNSTRSGDEALSRQSVKPTYSEPTQTEQQAESTGISQSSRSIEKNDIVGPVVSLEEGSGVDNLPTKDDLCISYIYLSRLDISADLVEPEVFDQCTSLIDVDQNVLSDADVSKILCVEEAREAKVAPPHEIMSYTLFPPADDSVFQKAMSLYKRSKDNFKAEVGEKSKVSSLPNSDQEDQNTKNYKTEVSTMDNNMQGAEDTLPNNDIEVDLPSNSSKLEVAVEKLDILDDADMTEKSEERENVKVSDDSLHPEVKEVSAISGSDNEEIVLVDPKSGPFLNKDVSSEVEAVMQDSVVSNLSRIHHSPESTH